MSKSLSQSLSQFMASTQEDSFDNPFREEESDEKSIKKPLGVNDIIDHSKETTEIRKTKARKKDKISRILDQGDQMIEDLIDDQLVSDFDGYIERYIMDDEDVELKRSLIKYGRKYARDTKTTGESSEVNKAYAQSEEVLSKLLDEVDADRELVQKDITGLRIARSRNYKALSELISAKATFHKTALDIVKEMNSMKKSQFDIQMKLDKTKKEEQSDDTASNRAIQQLFGMGRDSIMSSLGGYGGVSGSSEAGIEEDTYDYDEDEIIQKKYFSDNDEVESDGDKFLKYEGMGVHYILLYNDDGIQGIIAEDKDGNVVPDYPIPTNPKDLDFTISESTGTATDNLTNQYELRRVDSDYDF